MTPPNPTPDAIIEPPKAPSREQARALVDSFPFWYHRIYLGNGVYTLPYSPAFSELVWDRFELAFPDDLRGASVLDVGCNAGYFSIQTKRRGAGRVLGIESQNNNFRQAVMCADIWDLDIEYRRADAHELNAIEEEFDLVVFAGILYHIKNPIHVLEQVGRVCRDAILLETEVIAENRDNRVYARQGLLGKAEVTECRSGFMKFIEAKELNGDGSNWWVPDTECVMGMLRSAGFKYFSTPRYFGESRLVLIASKKPDSILNLRALDDIEFGDEQIFRELFKAT